MQPPAVVGQNGLRNTLEIVEAVLGFGLTDGEALAAMEKWNAACSPPWELKELLDLIEHAQQIAASKVAS